MSQSHSAPLLPRSWWLPLGILLAVTLLSYVGSYAWLYQRGLTEADDAGLPDTFLFVPVESVNQSHDLTLHYRRRMFYEPMNWVHYQWFGGRPACLGILFDLS